MIGLIHSSDKCFLAGILRSMDTEMLSGYREDSSCDVPEDTKLTDVWLAVPWNQSCVCLPATKINEHQYKLDQHFLGDHDQTIWGNAQLASSGNPTFWETRFALETTGKKSKSRKSMIFTDESWGDDCSWVDFGYVFAMLQRLLHFQQWKWPWPEVLLAVWRWGNLWKRLCWMMYHRFFCRYFLPWKKHETCKLCHWEEEISFENQHLQVSNLSVVLLDLGHWIWGMNIHKHIHTVDTSVISLTGIEDNWHPGTGGTFSTSATYPRAFTSQRANHERFFHHEITLADPSLFPTWKCCSTWNYREERCDLK